MSRASFLTALLRQGSCASFGAMTALLLFLPLLLDAQDNADFDFNLKDNLTKDRRLGCNKNADCASKWCEGGTFYKSGTCTPQRADGEAAAGNWPAYDYNICLAGNGICGKCGLRQPDGSTCTENSDCSSTWCEGRGSCAGKCQPTLSDGTRVSCTDALSVGSGGCDYNKCTAKAGKCGICGWTVVDGSKCSANSDCTSGACRVASGVVSTSVVCSGMCVPKQPDGTILSRLSSPIPINGQPSFYDYSECQANTGSCGTCGKTMPEGALCSANADCGEGLCCSGRVSVDCQGRCVKQSPNACPSLVDMSLVKAAVQALAEVAGKLAMCMVGQDKLDQVADVDALTCKFGGSFGDQRLNLDCQTLDPENARRLAAEDKSNASALSLGYSSFLEARDTPVIEKFSVGTHFSAIAPPASNVRVESSNSSRQLFGYGTAAAPMQKTLACKENLLCQAGASLSYYAEVKFKPKLSFAFAATGTPKATIKLGGSLTGSVGVLAMAGGTCSKTWKVLYPQTPKPVATYCLYLLCVAISIQGFAELSLDGSIEAHASAVYTAVYEINGGIDLELDVSKLNQASGVTLQLSRSSDSWALNAYGSFSAAVSAKIGPSITVVVTPGAFVNVKPYITGEISLFGEMAYVRSSESGTSTSVNWPTEISCDGKKLKNKTAYGKSTTSTQKNSSSGEGFTVEVASVSDQDASKICLATGIAVIYGAEVTGIGPPVDFEPKDIFASVCTKMTEYVTKKGQFLAADCLGKAVLGDGFTGFAGGAQAVCDKLVAMIPNNPINNIKFGSIEGCFDLWSDYVGTNSQCLCNVGCLRRKPSAQCSAVAYGIASAAPAAQLCFGGLLVLFVLILSFLS